MPRNNRLASFFDSIRQVPLPSSAVSTAAQFARNREATDTAETGAALSRNNDFTFRHPSPPRNSRALAAAVLRQPSSQPSLVSAFAWHKPVPPPAPGTGYRGRIAERPRVGSSRPPAAEPTRVKEEEVSELEYLDDTDEGGEHDEEEEESEEEYDEDEKECDENDEEEETEGDDSDEGSDDEDDEDGDAADGGNGPAHRPAGGDDSEDDGDRGSASSNDDSSEDEERGAGRQAYCYPYRHVYPAEYQAWHAQQAQAARGFVFAPPPPPVVPAPTAPAALAAAPIPALAAVAMPNMPAIYPQVFHLPPLVAVPPRSAARAATAATAPGGGRPTTWGLHIPTPLPPLRVILGEYLTLGVPHAPTLAIGAAHAAPAMMLEVPPVPPNTPAKATTFRGPQMD